MSLTSTFAGSIADGGIPSEGIFTEDEIALITEDEEFLVTEGS